MARTRPIQQFSWRYMVWFQLTGATGWYGYEGYGESYTNPSYTSFEAIPAKVANYMIGASGPSFGFGHWQSASRHLLIRSPKWGQAAQVLGWRYKNAVFDFRIPAAPENVAPTQISTISPDTAPHDFTVRLFDVAISD